MALPLTSRVTVWRGPAWRTVLMTGFALWVASVAALVATDDEILVPAAILFGSFLVPVTCVFWLLEHGHHTTLTPARLLAGFFVAGVLGLLLSAVLEIWLVPTRMVPNLWVALIEEAVKTIGLLIVGRGLARYRVRDGIILGVTVGLGFGAFEASGYSLSYSVQGGSFSPQDLVSEELLRAAIAPFGHGVWTGLVGAAAFAAAAANDNRPAWSWRILGAYLVAVALHATWDASSNAAVVLTVLLDGDAGQRSALSGGSIPAPSTVHQQLMLGVIQWAIMTVVAIVGVWLVSRRWRVLESPSMNGGAAAERGR
jgi:RsiW-degrading membrane proteinase PrsW (M82 family)